MMSDNYSLIAPTLFGIEGIAADEFRRMGFNNVVAENGRVCLKGGADMLARANICSRFAERILINAGQFTALSFNDLFEGNTGSAATSAYPSCPTTTISGRSGFSPSSKDSKSSDKDIEPLCIFSACSTLERP